MKLTEEDAIARWMGKHGYLIVSSTRDLKPGDTLNVGHKFTLAQRGIFQQPFVVLREATKAEYMAQCEAIRKLIGASAAVKAGKRFYAVTTD